MVKMKQITKDTVLSEHVKTPLRKCFQGNSAVKSRPKPTFLVQFFDSIGPIFEYQTGLKLSCNKEGKSYFHRINSVEELEVIFSWEKQQGSLIFLRDCLSLSIALDFNRTSPTSGKRTLIGELVHQGKWNKDQDAINKLADIVAPKISTLPFYKDADLICSVPSSPGKEFDFLSSVTALVRANIGKQDVTKGFVFDGKKSSVTEASFNEKWNVWEDAKVSFQNGPAFNVSGKTIVLIDDKYQSGRTIQYIAMKLQEAGAREVYGVCFVKTLRDRDNK